MIRIGIVGGTGYTGVELLRLLAQHPQAELVAITSRKEAGMPVAEMFPSLRGHVDLAFCDPAEAPFSRCDVVFFATPHGVAMSQARELLAAGVRVIDLAADFRLRDPAEFERWYKMPHACPDILAEAVYGLPEVNREAIRSARVVGLPGCYPTSVQLGFLPLLDPAAVAAAGGDIVERDSLLVFLYRQGLELQLKLILPLARRLAGKEAVADHQHGLMPLWNELRRHLQQLDPREDDKELAATEDFIRQLDTVDPGSFAFRYPRTKKGEVSLPELRHVNVRHLSEVMDSVFMLLGGIYSWLGEMDQNDGYY